MSYHQEVTVHLKGQASPFHTRLMGLGIFEGSKIQLIKDDPINQLVILGIGFKRVVLRNEELINIEFHPTHG